MGIYEYATEFAGKPVQDWDPEEGIAAPEDVHYAVRLSYDQAEEGVRWTDLFARYLADPAASRTTGLVIGNWAALGGGRDQGSEPVVQALVAARDRLPNLTALFLGDITSEENEISWIQQSDVSPLFGAFPNLEHLTLRGGNELRLGAVRHARLESLVIQSGGLNAEVVRSVAAATLPQLEHLELWLGEEEYGADFTLEDLEAILAGTQFPNLRYLGLRDSERADVIAAAVAEAPVLSQIRILDLSLGTLGDDGARALLASEGVRGLEKLVLSHHFCSDEVVAELEELEIEVDVSDRQDPDEYDDVSYRYIAVGE